MRCKSLGAITSQSEFNLGTDVEVQGVFRNEIADLPLRLIVNPVDVE